MAKILAIFLCFNLLLIQQCLTEDSTALEKLFARFKPWFSLTSFLNLELGNFWNNLNAVLLNIPDVIENRSAILKKMDDKEMTSISLPEEKLTFKNGVKPSRRFTQFNKYQLFMCDWKITEPAKELMFVLFHVWTTVVRTLQGSIVTDDKVTFYLFTAQNSNNSHQLLKLNTSDLEEFRNTSSKIIFIIHGWVTSRKINWYEEIKQAFLDRDNTTMVIEVDWERPAMHPLYYMSSSNTDYVSIFISELIVDLHKNYSVPIENFLLVGHSLGAHISGIVGKLFQKETHKKLPRILALDPAGVDYPFRPKNRRLDKDDAEVVEVIHTNGGLLGYKGSIGTIDFYVNGGSRQPQCNFWHLTGSAIISVLKNCYEHFDNCADNIIKKFKYYMLDLVSCSHQQVQGYLRDALRKPTDFLAQKCDSLEIWQNQKDFCKKEYVYMGDLTTTQTGDFYLDINVTSNAIEEGE